jgi:hypothetical protein
LPLDRWFDRRGDALPGGGHFVTTGWFGVADSSQFSFNNRGEVAFAATLDTDDNVR